MSRPSPTWRALAERLGRALEDAGADDLGEAVEALDELAARARGRRIEGEVLEDVTAHPGTTSNGVVVRLRRDRSLVLRALRVLESSAVLTFEPGPKGARLWSAKKDRCARINRSA